MPVPKSGRSLGGAGRPPNVGHVHGEDRRGVADEVGALRQEQHGDEGLGGGVAVDSLKFKNPLCIWRAQRQVESNAFVFEGSTTGSYL